jgi:hypothetical protein
LYNDLKNKEIKMPAKNVTYCGLNCGMCPAYIATVKDSNEERIKVAELWTKEFGTAIKAEDINCMGCKSEGPHFSHCSNCEIRSCASGKSIPNYGHCSVEIEEKTVEKHLTEIYKAFIVSSRVELYKFLNNFNLTI